MYVMYVCVYVCMYVVCACMYVCSHVCMYACLCVCNDEVGPEGRSELLNGEERGGQGGERRLREK